MILLAVLTLALNVTTRTFSDPNPAHHTSQTQTQKRQHLAADAADAILDTATRAPLGVLPMPVLARRAPVVEFRIHTAELTESLFTRPPPSSSLL